MLYFQPVAKYPLLAFFTVFSSKTEFASIVTNKHGVFKIELPKCSVEHFQFTSELFRKHCIFTIPIHCDHIISLSKEREFHTVN